MESISHHIMPLVINSFRGGHTHTNTHTDVCTETILRNQVSVRHRQVHTRSKNNSSIVIMRYLRVTFNAS